MNNKAFQKLVRDKAGIKTTKEIAREAVEAEFEEVKRKQQHCSSDDDSDNKRRKDRRRVVKETKPKDPSELDRLAQTYRDRAKDRREGKEGDSFAEKKSASDQIFDDVVQAFESGDRRKLKRIRIAKDEDSSRLAETADQALAWIANPSTPPTTALGREVLDYLRRQYLPVAAHAALAVSAAGRNLQRSKLTFSWVADPRDRRRSWEHPLEEQTYAGTGDATAKATPCDDNLLREIKRCLEKHRRVREEGALNEKQSNRPAVQPTREGSEAEDEQHAVASSDNGEDDDIFGNVGDYDGAAVTSIDNEAGNPSEFYQNDPIMADQKKGSIFGGTLAASSEIITLGEDPLDQQDRYVAETSRPLARFSELQSGYGDDGIGMDFDGMDCEDDEDDKNVEKDNKKKKKTRKERRAERSPS
jgi:hypothetical protein